MTTGFELVELPPSSRPRATASPLWMLSFVDLISLLVAFFMLLFALSGRSPEEWQQVAAPIAAYWHGGGAMTTPDLATAPAPRRPASRNLGLGYVAALVVGWQAADPALAELNLSISDDGLRLELPTDLVEAIASGRGGQAGQAAILDAGAQAKLAHIGSQLKALGNPVEVMVSGIGSPDRAMAWSDAVALAQAVSAQLGTTGLQPAVSNATLDPVPGAVRRIELIIREAEGLH